MRSKDRLSQLCDFLSLMNNENKNISVDNFEQDLKEVTFNTILGMVPPIIDTVRLIKNNIARKKERIAKLNKSIK